ncbi:MAG: iron-sulfur cluster insertion protein ErpA [Anaerolineae bacterium]|nr:iron-sulfur cluster insertion protein ErpA [Anaerolineae bacterium]
MDRPVVEEQILSVTPAALSKIRELLEQRQIPNHALRVFVTGGGCSGLSYGMAFEENIQEYDTLVEVEGVKLVVDATSILYLKGSVIDFVDSLMGGGFSIDNPQAVSTCGCGHSFRTGESGEASEGGCSTCH